MPVPPRTESRATEPASRVRPAAVDGFTAHNIRLDDGRQTFPSAGWLIGDSTLMAATRRMLQLAFPAGLRDKRIADLGCLEGGYTVEFARLGMQATGIEVRDSNYRNCLRVKAGVNLPNLSFVKDDVNNIGRYQAFDAVFACGLLYHLDKPHHFLRELSNVCRRVVFLDTHVAPPDGHEAVTLHSLSPLTEHEGLRGRWYTEYEQATAAELDQMKWHSWSNNRSFWIVKEHLLQAMKQVGFDIVLEQFDCEQDIPGAYCVGSRSTASRVLLVGIKT